MLIDGLFVQDHRWLIKLKKVLFFYKQRQITKSSNYKLVLPTLIINIQEWKILKDIWIMLRLLGAIQI